MGGLLLWGVDARTNRTTKLDQIVNFEPIAEIARFKSEMARLAVEALMPRHAGILVEAIPETFPNETSGYLAMYVERSERRPHRCEFGDKYYYRRAGSTSRSMEHFEIEDAFRRFAVPQLSLDYVPIYTGQSADAYRGTVTISLELTSTNISRVSARFPYVAVKLIRPLLPDPHRAAPGVLPSRRDDWQYFEGGADIVIYPGVSRRMGSVRFDVPFSIVEIASFARSLNCWHRWGCDRLALAGGSRRTVELGRRGVLPGAMDGCWRSYNSEPLNNSFLQSEMRLNCIDDGWSEFVHSDSKRSRSRAADLFAEPCTDSTCQ